MAKAWQSSPAEPVLRDFRNIENRDAVLDWDARVERCDEAGALVTRRDGVGNMEHSLKDERVPDPQARTQVWDYLKPRPAKWPEATLIVGNPPFIGDKRMKETLGEGYVEALRNAYQNPAGHAAASGEQTGLDVGFATTAAKTPWPACLPDQIAAVRATLQDIGQASPAEIVRHFARARTASVQPQLESLTALAQAGIIEGGRFAA